MLVCLNAVPRFLVLPVVTVDTANQMASETLKALTNHLIAGPMWECVCVRARASVAMCVCVHASVCVHVME